MVYITMKQIFIFLASWVVFVVICFNVYNVAIYPKLLPQSAMTCVLRKMDPWDESFAPAFDPSRHIQCKKSTFPFFFVNESGYILYNKTALGKINSTDLKCSYQTVIRDSDMQILLGQNSSFKVPSIIRSRNFLITCTDMNDKLLYKYVHSNVAHNKSIKRENQIQFESDQRPSIIIFGFDSISRLHALRNFQSTYTYMTGVLGAYDFSGYNVVGENTFPNVLALVAGRDWRHMTGSSSIKGYLDFLPLLWKNKKRYATYMCENRPGIEAFRYLKKGFKKPPADYHCRPLMQAMAQNSPVVNTIVKPSDECYGNKNYLEIQVDHLKRFMSKYTGKLKSVFMWNNIGHDSFRVARNADQPVQEFLRWLKSNGHLNNTILLLVSDHGFRMGGASKLPVGRTEIQNPMFLMYVPDSFKQRHRWMENNLYFNKDKLITPHDVYLTLQDFMNGSVHDAEMKVVSSTSLQPRRLFQKVPEHRTCEDAGIPTEYCLRCFEVVLLDTETEHANIMANFSVMTLNKRLKRFSRCRQLTLASIKRYQKVLVPIDNRTVNKASLYLISYITKPGYGFFNALLSYNSDLPLNESNINPVGVPLRMSVVGKQSHCVRNHPSVKMSCYCK